MNGEQAGVGIEEVVQFLFSPKALTLPFLVVMIIVGAAGAGVGVINLMRFYARLRIGSSTYADEAQGLQTKFDPEAFLRLVTRPQTVVRVVSAPGPILLTLGILGTFLGLGLALSGASEMFGSDPAANVSALKGVLSAVCFKFQTSAWGVLLSLVFTTFVQLPIEGLVERSITRSATDLMRFRKSGDEAVAAAIQTAIRDSFSNVAEALRTSAVQLAGSTAMLQQQVTGLTLEVTKSGTDLRDSATVMSEAASKLSGLGAEIGRELRGVSKSLNDASSRNTEEMTKNLTANSDALKKSLTDGNAAAVAAANAQAADLKLKLDGLNNAIGGALGQMESTLKTSGEKSNLQIQGALGGAASAQKEVAQALGSVNKTVGDLRTDMGKSMSALSQHQAETTAAIVMFNDVLANFRKSFDELTKVMSAQQEAAGRARMAQAVQGGPSAGPRDDARPPVMRTKPGGSDPFGG